MSKSGAATPPNGAGAGAAPAAPAGKKKVDKKHPEFELTYDMMLGIRTSIGQVENKPKRNLKDADMQATVRMTFPATGSTQTPAHQMRDYKFKDYAPEVFRHIRNRFGINPVEYILSVCGNFEYLEFISNSKSGQFFFYTHDRKYMIKTISDDECKFLRKILPDYYNHIDKNPNTLLTRFYGMHRVKPHKNKEFHFLIMGSVFYTDKFIHLTFDLKGSTHGRAATEKEKKSRENCVYKDLDFLRMKQTFDLGQQKGELLTKQLQSDAEFLKKLNIMDYSLLVGVHFTDKAEEPLPRMSIDAGKLDPNKRLVTPVATPTGAASAAAAAGAGAGAHSPSATPPLTATPVITAHHSASSSVLSSSSGSPTSGTASTPPSMSALPPAGTAPPAMPALPPTLVPPPALLIPANNAPAIAPAIAPAAAGAGGAGAAGDKKNASPRREPSNHTNADGTIKTEVVDVDRLDEMSPRAQAVIRRQSHYGVPKNHQVVTPALINFKAPDLVPPPLPNTPMPLIPGFGLPTLQPATAPVPLAAAPAAGAGAGANGAAASAAGAGTGAGAAGAAGAGANGKAAADGKAGSDAKAAPAAAANNKPAGVQSIWMADDGGVRSVDPANGRAGNQIYFMGIIDILTLYDAKKKIESFAKGLTHDANTISAVSPPQYASRFVKFISAAIK